MDIFPQMEIIDCESLENFLKHVCDGVCVNKIASLCCTNGNSTITRIYHRTHHEKTIFRALPQRFSHMVSATKLFIKFRKSFTRYFCHSLTSKVADLQSIGCNFTRRNCLIKTPRTNSKL